MTYGAGNSGDYKRLKGQMIQVTDTDPIAYAGSWASGGNMNTARQYVGAFGTQTAGLVAGGETSTSVNNVEQYDGTSWTEVAEINTTRYGLEGFGNSYTSGFVVGGAPDKAETESWNGTSWTEVGDLPQGVERGGCAGTSTSAFYVGGYKYPSPAGSTNVGYDWDGSSWGTGNNINTTRDRMGAAGVVTSGIVFGGTSPGGQHAQAELYNGSAWTETGDLNTARRELGASGFDRTNAQALGFGGEPPAVAHTESFDGSAWTEVANLSTARAAGGGLGTSTLAAFAGGSGLSAATEEWSFPSTPVVQEGQLWIKTASGTSSVMKGYQAQGTGAWATGATMGTTRAQVASAGIQTASIFAGGIPFSVNAETYNGTAWAEVSNLNTGRTLNVGGGIQTAAISAGGITPSVTDAVESWNGSSWSEVAEINTARRQGGGTGKSQSAVLIVGGEGSPFADQKGKTEIWDGSSWTEVGDLNDGRTQITAFGTSTSAVGTSGHPGSGETANTETWDGTAWTEVANLNQSREGAMSAGNSSGYGIACGGRDHPTYYNNTEVWNGSSWTEVAELNSASYNGSMAGSGVLGIKGGGSNPGTGGSTGSEEWTVPFVTKTVGTD